MDEHRPTGGPKSLPRRILYFCTALEGGEKDGDWGEFPINKYQQLSEGRADGKRKGNEEEKLDSSNSCKLDLWMMGFIGAGKGKDLAGTWATVLVDDDDSTTNPGPKEKSEKKKKKIFKRVSDVSAWDALAIKAFVEEHYLEGTTHLVIGTHGVGDYFWLDAYTKDGGKTVDTETMSYSVDTVLEDAGFLSGGYTFLSTILDCCLMGEVFTQHHFSPITPFVGCGEGFAWSSDHDLNKSMFSIEAARALSDGDNYNTYEALIVAGRHYVMSAVEGRNDFSIFNTAHATALVQYLTETPIYAEILKDALKHTNSFGDNPVTSVSKYCFYFVEKDQDGTDDAQYLLDVYEIARVHQDRRLTSLYRSVVMWHRGQTCGETCGYRFQLPGLSITCAHAGDESFPKKTKKISTGCYKKSLF